MYASDVNLGVQWKHFYISQGNDSVNYTKVDLWNIVNTLCNINNVELNFIIKECKCRYESQSIFNRHIECTEIIEHLGSEALSGILVQHIYIKQLSLWLSVKPTFPQCRVNNIACQQGALGGEALRRIRVLIKLLPALLLLLSFTLKLTIVTLFYVICLQLKRIVFNLSLTLLLVLSPKLLNFITILLF